MKVVRTKNLSAEDVKELRAATNMSQTEFAAKLGVSYVTVYRWEHGVSTPIQALQNALKQLWNEYGEIVAIRRAQNNSLRRSAPTRFRLAPDENE